MMYFELITISQSVLSYVMQCHGRAEDINMLPVYLEYKALLAEGNKKEYIYAVIKDKYHIGRAAILAMAAKMETIVNLK